MKSVAVILLVALIGFVYCRPDEKYTTKYDNVDIDEILKSDRLINNYFKCLMGTQKCTNDGAELRDVLPDALAHECSKCSQKHKDASTKIIHFLIDNKRALWDDLEKKYDPTGAYRKKYDGQIKKEGLKL